MFGNAFVLTVLKIVETSGSDIMMIIIDWQACSVSYNNNNTRLSSHDFMNRTHLKAKSFYFCYKYVSSVFANLEFK